jgi:hypothetical protein
MRIKVLLSLAVAGLALTGCASAPAGALSLDTTLKAPTALPPIIDRAAGIELHSCADLIGVLRAGKDLGEAAERPQFNAWADCVAVALIADARPAPDAAFDVDHAGGRLYRDLDLAGVASSLAQRKPAEHYRLQDFKFDAVTIAPLHAQLQGNGFIYTFDVLALGDFRHAGRSELLVRFTDRASNQGSYDRRSVLVIDAGPQPPALVATDAMDVLKAGTVGH